MPHSLSAKKRARQSIRRNRRNSSQRSAMRTAIKRTLTAIDSGNRAEAETAYQTVTVLLDRYSHNGLIHKNKAARHKSRLNAKIKALAS